MILSTYVIGKKAKYGGNNSYAANISYPKNIIATLFDSAEFGTSNTNYFRLKLYQKNHLPKKQGIKQNT